MLINKATHDLFSAAYVWQSFPTWNKLTSHYWTVYYRCYFFYFFEFWKLLVYMSQNWVVYMFARNFACAQLFLDISSACFVCCKMSVRRCTIASLQEWNGLYPAGQSPHSCYISGNCEEIQLHLCYVCYCHVPLSSNELKHVWNLWLMMV